MKKVLGAMAKIIFAVFSIAILGMMMSYTWGALGILFPNSFINRLWGMVLFDIAAMSWALAFAFESKSTGQYAAAGIGFVTAFLGTILMVAAEVVMSGQTFVQNNTMGEYMVYGFIVVTCLHAALVYYHAASSPQIASQISIGVARGEIETEAIRQATTELDEQKADLATTISKRISNDVKRDLNLPTIAVDPAVGFVEVPAAQAPQPVKKESLADKVNHILHPPAKMQKHEQTVVQQATLQEPPKPVQTKTENPPAGDAPFPG